MKPTKRLIPPIYVLHADGVGEFAMRNESGNRCMFVFTSRDSVIRFCELMERPNHTELTAIELDSAELILTFLREIKQTTELIAIDPVANCEFTPVAVDDFIHLQLSDD